MKRWTPEDEGLLRRLYPAKPITDIAHALGRGADGVAAKLTRLGLRVPLAENPSITRTPQEQIGWLSEYARIDADGCHIWAGALAGKPPAPTIVWGSKRYRAKRLLAELTGLLSEQSCVVYSSCGKALCMKREHLRAGTRAQAIAAAKARGTWCTGIRRAVITATARARKAKLPITEHERLRAMRANGMSVTDIAKHYGVGRDRVNKAIKSWSRITGIPL